MRGREWRQAGLHEAGASLAFLQTGVVSQGSRSRSCSIRSRGRALLDGQFSGS